MASPLRLNAALIEAAEREGAVQKRSVPRQIEFWAELGKADTEFNRALQNNRQPGCAASRMVGPLSGEMKFRCFLQDRRS